MNIETIIGSAVGVIVVGSAALGIFIKVILADWKQWRERVEDKIDKLEPERVNRHFDKVHQLSNEMLKLMVSMMHSEKEILDHEGRIRILENGGKS